ncbi:MAG: hypothetical protein GY895_05520 [Phycisphaera sp.]|nr:hypothetical protein [Phycisphaera sp.]
MQNIFEVLAAVPGSMLIIPGISIILDHLSVVFLPVGRDTVEGSYDRRWWEE